MTRGGDAGKLKADGCCGAAKGPDPTEIAARGRTASDGVRCDVRVLEFGAAVARIAGVEFAARLKIFEGASWRTG